MQVANDWKGAIFVPAFRRIIPSDRVERRIVVMVITLYYGLFVLCGLECCAARSMSLSACSPSSRILAKSRDPKPSTPSPMHRE